MNPGAVFEINAVPIGLKNGVRLPPKNSHADFRDGRITLLQVRHHFLNRLAGIDHIVDEQHFPFQFGESCHAVSNVEIALHGALGFAVRARCENRERLAVDTAEEIAGTHAAAREADQAVKLPAALGDLIDELFVQTDVLVPRVGDIGHGWCRKEGE